MLLLFLTPQVADGLPPFIPQGVSKQKQNPMIIHTHALLILRLVPILTSLLIDLFQRGKGKFWIFSLLCLIIKENMLIADFLNLQ